MKLGLMLGYWGARPPEDPLGIVLEAERLGYETVWTAEAYGSDCFSPLCWLGARTERIKLGTSIMQLSARTPVCAAMTALTIDHLSNGRLVLGSGVSGPQVVEGWYGQAFPRPLQRTREWVEIFRKVIAREAPVHFEGQQYQLPLQGGAGLGKPLKSITHPLRDRIPVYLGAEGPKNVALAAEICDGWLPIFFSPYRAHIYEASLAGRPDGFEIPCTVTVIPHDDVAEALRMVKPGLAFYIGGMGAPEQNFHLNLMCRMGFEEQALHVQELFLAGKRAEAIEAVPDDLADEISLVGPADRICDRLKAWIESPVTELVIGARDPAILKLMADALS